MSSSDPPGQEQGIACSLSAIGRVSAGVITDAGFRLVVAHLAVVEHSFVPYMVRLLLRLRDTLKEGSDASCQLLEDGTRLYVQ